MDWDLVGGAVTGLLVFVGTYVVLDADTCRLIRAGPARLMDALGTWNVAQSRRGSASKKARRKQVLSEMPTFLDILTLGLSAGLSFDASVELYCKRYDTPLAQMLWDEMLTWRMGVCGRGEALRSMAFELEAPAVERFAASVEEALSFGTPLSAVLERQAQIIRDEQKSQVEEEIERVPVKMLIPLGTLIVPAMLLAILGPLLGPALGTA